MKNHRTLATKKVQQNWIRMKYIFLSRIISETFFKKRMGGRLSNIIIIIAEIAAHSLKKEKKKWQRERHYLFWQFM